MGIFSPKVNKYTIKVYASYTCYSINDQKLKCYINFIYKFILVDET